MHLMSLPSPNILQDHPCFPCGRAKDREEGSEDPKDQGEDNFKMRQQWLPVSMRTFWRKMMINV